MPDTFDIYCDGHRLGYTSGWSAVEALADFLVERFGGQSYSEVEAERARLTARADCVGNGQAEVEVSHYRYAALARVV